MDEILQALLGGAHALQRDPIGSLTSMAQDFIRDPLMTSAAADAMDSGNVLAGLGLAAAGVMSVVPGAQETRGLRFVQRTPPFETLSKETLERHYREAILRETNRALEQGKNIRRPPPLPLPPEAGGATARGNFYDLFSASANEASGILSALRRVDEGEVNR